MFWSCMKNRLIRQFLRQWGHSALCKSDVMPDVMSLDARIMDDDISFSPPSTSEPWLRPSRYIARFIL